MKGSKLIYQFIAHEEALVTVPYRDGEQKVVGADGTISVVPKYSQGFGEGGVPADNPPWTIEYAFERFYERMARAEKELDGVLKVPVAQQEYDALLACLDNRGMTRTKPVIDLVNAYNKNAAWALQRSLCLSSHGDYIDGLAKRRDREIEVARNGHYGAVDTYKLWTADPRATPYEIKDFPKEPAS